MSYIKFTLNTAISIADANFYAALILRTYYDPKTWDQAIEDWLFNETSAENSLESELSQYLREFGTQGMPKKLSKKLLDPTQAADLKYCIFLNFAEAGLYKMTAQDVYSLLNDYLSPNVAAPDRAMLDFAVRQLNDCELRTDYQGLYEDRLYELNVKITRAEDELIGAFDED